MYIDRQSHWQFFEDELKAQTEDFKKKYLSTAISLLRINGEMFVAQFVGMKDGELVMKFPNTRALPRKGEFLVCMLLPPHLQDYKNWGDKTYKELYQLRYNSTECVCVWHSPTEDNRFSLVGFSKVSVDFANYIKNSVGIILTFAPKRPPIDYIISLQKIVKDELSPNISEILDLDYQKNDWEPTLIAQDDVAGFVYSQLQLTDTMILEGPPGTGKTYMIAELCSKLCAEGKSVLVTALTNRALIEIAQKSSVASLLDQHKIFKTNLTTDELKEVSKLKSIKEILPMPSCLVLSTYYISSGFATELSLEQPFDYVIMDEASQALLAMFAACKKLGKKNLWVGDTHQLMPIVTLNEEISKRNGYQCMISGLKLLADNSSSPIYQLTNSYRFGQRTADYTGIFYNNSLKSKRNQILPDYPSLYKLFSKDGGPTLILTDMPSGNKSPLFASVMAAYIVDCILRDNKNKEVAVLTCLKDTVRTLQSAINQNIGPRKNLIVDTVARVQGLTTDIVLFFVPDYSYIRTLEPHLFNVATSRAKEHTIIIADKYVFDCPTIDKQVRAYLERLKEDHSVYIPEFSPKDANTQKSIDYQNLFS